MTKPANLPSLPHNNSICIQRRRISGISSYTQLHTRFLMSLASLLLVLAALISKRIASIKILFCVVAETLLARCGAQSCEITKYNKRRGKSEAKGKQIKMLKLCFTFSSACGVIYLHCAWLHHRVVCSFDGDGECCQCIRLPLQWKCFRRASKVRKYVMCRKRCQALI